MDAIKAIIFDQGGVLVAEGLKAMWGDLYNAAHDIPQWHQFTRGKISQPAYYQAIAQKTGKPIDEKAIEQQFLKYHSVNTEVIDLIKQLKQRYKVCLISNFPKEWAQLLDRKCGLLKLFYATSISGYTGFRKPEKAAFDIILKKLKLKPSECLFIDDRQKYVDVAKEYGFESVLFESAGQIKKALATKFSLL